MLVLRLVVREARRAFLHDEPARTAGRVRQNRVGVGDAAVADPLLAAVDLVADDPAVLAAPRSAVVCRAPRSLPASGSVAP